MIVNASGRLVHQGQSTGGSYSWNGRLASGKRCASGIYYVLATNEQATRASWQVPHRGGIVSPDMH
jgi:hypothetical protein